jgi:hypothetical protein
MATRRFSRVDGKEFARPRGSTLAANGRSSAGDARRDPSLLFAGRPVPSQRQIQIGASLLVIGFGIFRFVNRRHPRVMARIRSTQLGLWSFAVAIAHGAGLMLVPIYLGLCRAADLNGGNEAAGALINANLGMAVLVSVVHSVTMIVAGGILAWLVYRYLGLKFVSRSWFNLDATWASSLILVGALSLAINLASRH